LPAYSCFDVATAAVGAGSEVVFYDIDPTTLSPVQESFERALEAGVAAAVVGNLYGYPVDWTFLRKTAASADVTLVEDAAQGLGTTWGEEDGGVFGELTVLSFGRGKGWTGGGGGALLARGPIAGQTRSRCVQAGQGLGGDLKASFLSLAQWALGRPSFYGIPASIPALGLGETRYKEPKEPVSMGGFQVSLLLATARSAREEVGRRRETAAQLLAILSEGGVEAPLHPIRPLTGGGSSFLRLPTMATSDPGATGLAPREKALGIVRGYPQALPDLPQIQPARVEQPEHFPGARALARRLLTLPTHSLLTSADLGALELLLSPSSGGTS
jgi:dTDP-4-amino-4,6-dideoxygalactose transaminase